MPIKWTPVDGWENDDGDVAWGKMFIPGLDGAQWGRILGDGRSLYIHRSRRGYYGGIHITSSAQGRCKQVWTKPYKTLEEVVWILECAVGIRKP